MKIASFFKKLLCVLLALVVFIISFAFYCTYSYSRINKKTHAAVLADYSLITDNVYSDSSITEDTMYAFENFISVLLPAFISQLSTNVVAPFNEDWSVIISAEFPATLEKFNSENSLKAPDQIDLDYVISGYSNWQLRIIYIYLQADPSKMYESFIHELGHCFDYEFGSPSLSGEFLDIYSTYKASSAEKGEDAFSKYAVSTTSEFFASVFTEYFLTPEHLEEIAPDAYHYFDNLYKEVTNNSRAASTLKYDLQSAVLRADAALKEFLTR